MFRFDCDECAFAELAQTLRKAPYFDLRDDADILADIEQFTITFCCPGEIEVILFRRTHRRGGQTRTADLANHVHRTAGVFQALFPPSVIVDDPLCKTDGAFTVRPASRIRLPKSREIAAIFDVGFQFVDPRFNGVVACFRRDADLIHNGDVLAANGAGVRE